MTHSDLKCVEDICRRKFVGTDLYISLKTVIVETGVILGCDEDVLQIYTSPWTEVMVEFDIHGYDGGGHTHLI